MITGAPFAAVLGFLGLGRQKALRVLMVGLREDIGDRSGLDHLLAHDEDSIGIFSNDAEIMGNQQRAIPSFL
jgi:hypothetical protein